jgi:histidinol-phosphate aminotransferase
VSADAGHGLRALVREQLRRVAVYDPGPSVHELEARYGVNHIVKLNWNEDLFGLLPGVGDAVVDELRHASLYPEQAYSDFRQLVAAFVGADPVMVVPAHGIQALVLSTVAVFVSAGDRVVLPQPTYGLYRQACEAVGAVVVRVPTDGYRLDLEAMARSAEGAKLVFVCDPNNPTGDALRADEWSGFLEELPKGCLAVVDEAYADYITPAERVGRVADVAAGRPVVVLHTFSKLFGIAGLRLGFAVVHPDLLACYDAVHEPFNVNRLALAAGTACLADADVIERRRLQVVGARERFAAALAGLGIASWPSSANFVLAFPGGDDLAWYESLLRRRFLVRPGSEFGLAGHLRITIGPDELMAEVATAMAEVGEKLASTR